MFDMENYEIGQQYLVYDNIVTAISHVECLNTCEGCYGYIRVSDKFNQHTILCGKIGGKLIHHKIKNPLTNERW